MDERYVGERLRAIRRQKGLSLHDVEARSNQEFKASVLGAYERGERAISVPRLLRLAELYRVPADQLLPRAHELAGWIAEASPEAVRRSRAVYRRFEEGVVADAMADGWDWVQRHWVHPDSDEGPRAFLERRDPEWHP